jgi:murein L,D-transpeptidase YafK
VGGAARARGRGGDALAVVAAGAVTLALAGALLVEPAGAAGATPPCRAPEIVVRKAARTLTLTCQGHRRARFGVSLGRTPVGPKRRAGDGRTPEGDYYVCSRNERSAFHLFLGLSYPGPEDAERGLRERLVTPAQARAIRDAHAARQAPPWTTPLGGAIGIHGVKNGWGFLGRFHRLFDWTNGCIAITDREIETLWESAPLGTPVRITP